MQYLTNTQKIPLSHFTHLYPYLTSRYMLLDSSTRRNLELTETLREKQKRGSLLGVLDKTKTAMGARTLRQYIEQPLIDKSEIEKRLDGISELSEKAMLRDEIREYLNRFMIWSAFLERSATRQQIPEICWHLLAP